MGKTWLALRYANTATWRHRGRAKFDLMINLKTAKMFRPHRARPCQRLLNESNENWPMSLVWRLAEVDRKVCFPGPTQSSSLSKSGRINSTKCHYSNLIVARKASCEKFLSF